MNEKLLNNDNEKWKPCTNKYVLLIYAHEKSICIMYILIIPSDGISSHVDKNKIIRVSEA